MFEKNPIGESLTQFIKINNMQSLNMPGHDITIPYLALLETRLNNCLLLLGNQDLCVQLGVDYNNLLSDAHNIIELCNQIQFPNNSQFQRKR